jgi:hypothetical protein
MLMRVKIFMLIEKFEATMNGKASRNAFFNASLDDLGWNVGCRRITIQTISILDAAEPRN